MTVNKTIAASVLAPFVLGFAGSVQAVPVTFSPLAGLTGGTPAGTGAYQADLSALGLVSIASISILDNSGGAGGASGQFSGFDLDAIALSTTNCADAACVAALTPGVDAFDLFDFSPAGTLFTPGSQRAPADPKLFGTDAGGGNVDNSVATLGLFDANSTTGATADGYISMGDDGLLSFNLTSSVSTAGLYLYIGEVGDNGEVAAGNITVSDRQVGVPEPGALALLAFGLTVLCLRRRRGEGV